MNKPRPPKPNVGSIVPAAVGRSMVSKKLIIDGFKTRLRDNIKSLNENFFQIVQAAKVNSDDNAYKNQTGKMTEFYTTKNEMAVRAQLMVRASDELLKLTTDLKEFLILHDFHFLTHNIKQAEAQCDEVMKQQNQQHVAIDVDLSNMLLDLETEINENFYLRHN